MNPIVARIDLSKNWIDTRIAIGDSRSVGVEMLMVTGTAADVSLLVAGPDGEARDPASGAKTFTSAAGRIALAPSDLRGATHIVLRPDSSAAGIARVMVTLDPTLPQNG